MGGVAAEAVDLLDKAVFNKYVGLARRGGIRWLHRGPPCKTFSRARRVDRHGSARILRSERFPEGLRDQRVADANMLAVRLAKLARIVRRTGGA